MGRGKQSGISFGQRNKQRGQSDLETLINIQNYIRKRYKISWIKREWYLLFSENEKLIMYKDGLTKEEIKGRIVKNPDIIFWHKKTGLVIIEVDGAVHDRKVGKTMARNELYRNAHIKLIVLNLADIKELKTTIEDYLDDEMKKIFQSKSIIKKNTKKGGICEE